MKCGVQKYSALMAVYIKDNPEYFAVALDSMIHQTVPPDEIVIVKDGPITEVLQAVIDERKGSVNINEVALKENHGLGYALNKGVKACRNELIARMDADDYSLPNRCEMQLVEFKRNPALDIIGCPVKEFAGEMGNIVGERKVPLTNEEIYNFEKIRDSFNHPTVIFRKSTVERAGGYSDYKKNQDSDLWIRLMKNGAVCMNLSETLVYFRFDEDTYRRRKTWNNVKSLIDIRYNAWKSGFNTLGEFLFIAMVHVCVYIMPASFQRCIYRYILRS